MINESESRNLGASEEHVKVSGSRDKFHSLLTGAEVETGGKPTNKYKVLCKGVHLDVYDILLAYAVTNPADQHAIKKMLMAGKRGVKDEIQDRKEAIQSLERAIELATGTSTD